CIEAGFPVRDGKSDTWRIETERKEYDEANEYIKDIEKLSNDLEVFKRARLTADEFFNYMPASHLKPTMSIAIFENNEIVEDVVKEVSIEEYEGNVYDISIPHFRQYISNGIVVHNSIYGWRGADIRNILDFEKDFPDTKIIKLEQNYRSTKNILTVANSIIKNNNERKNKKLWTDNTNGSPVILSKRFDEKDEANFAADTIEKLVNEGKYKLSDFAILYRTNAQSRAFEEIFMRKNISYKIVGGLKFYDRKEIKDIIAYLRLIQNPVDDISFRRIINVPKRGIGAATIEKIENYASKTGESLYSAILDVEDIPGISKRAINNLTKFTDMINKFMAMKEILGLKDFIEEVVNSTGYISELEKEDTIEATTRIENLKEFISVAVDFEMMEEEGSLEEFLSSISLLSDVDNMEETDESVTMLTVHSAKGLEFPVVFLVGMEDGLFPMGRALDSESELEEERRLCYVAITRAEELLYITHANLRTIYGNTTYAASSRFLKEIPESLVQDGNKEEKLNKKDGLSNMNDNKKEVEIGSKVRHKKWGIGTVVQIKERSGDIEIVVAFKEKGIKKLLLSIAPVEIL
ncbi:3'-5' exonuclease, partial [Anaerosalibacter massiliensis]|uniref:3'-5' exonuclease n=1 Tax=Anaerosalibacter massiliensis TaxID=1347392 RepID=UPI0005B2C16A